MPARAGIIRASERKCVWFEEIRGGQNRHRHCRERHPSPGGRADDRNSALPIRIVSLVDAGHRRAPRIMSETTIKITDALRGQQEQLKRLIAQKTWIADATQPTLAEIHAQITELKRLLEQLEIDIQQQRG